MPQLCNYQQGEHDPYNTTSASSNRLPLWASSNLLVYSCGHVVCHKYCMDRESEEEEQEEDG